MSVKAARRARSVLLLCLSAITLPAAASSSAPPDPQAVGAAIAARRDRVAEFRVIKAAAEELGFRVWLFGGTAAAFAHYVRWDLAREAGDPRYRESFFDYDFTNIYRSTQDADLVVDATPEQAEELERLLKRKMAFLQGSKDAWEVRLLRQDRLAPGGQLKRALLANPDFLGQNTDSNSTGMLELTDPPGAEPVVRDLRDWETPLPFFLQDVTAGRLHYYVSPTHQETSRYRSGDNPPIFSVIRYLVKAFQYGLQVEGEDLVRVRAIIDAFEPQRDYPALSPWARGWLERYGPNLIRHSVDVEYAWDTLESLRLREKLLSLSDPSTVGTLGWWLSREPLRTRPLGQGDSLSAADLGIEVVAHETGDFLAYESITRDMTLRPNVLISREGRPGESAVSGAGFYTQRGLIGGRGTGLTIRFRVDPRAREGGDFTVHGDMVLFTNRAALQVIPESLEASPVEYFQMLRSGVKADPSDRGIWTKLRRRLSIRPVSPGEEQEILAIVSEAIREPDQPVPPALLSEWFDRPAARQHPEILEAALNRPDLGSFLAREILPRAEWADRPEYVKALIGRSGRLNTELMEHVLSREAWGAYPQLMLAILRDGRVSNRSAQRVLRLPAWQGHAELLQSVVARAAEDRLQSVPSRSLAYGEAAYAVINDPVVTGRSLVSLRIAQISRDDGTFEYQCHPSYADRWHTPGRAAAVARMAALYAVRLSQVRAGLEASPGLASDTLIREVGRAYLLRQGGLLSMDLPMDNATRLHLRREMHVGFYPHPLPRDVKALEEPQLASLLAEAESLAKTRLEERWPAIEAAAQVLLREEGGLSPERLEEILLEAPRAGETRPWNGLLTKIAWLTTGRAESCR